MWRHCWRLLRCWYTTRGTQNNIDSDQSYQACSGRIGSQYSDTNSVSIPDECVALPRNFSGAAYNEPLSLSYSIMVGMLLHLTGHSCPHCSFATHQCACYTVEPKFSHLNALKRVGHYLKGALNKGLVLDPSNNLCFDCYPDADFVSLWGREC